MKRVCYLVPSIALLVSVRTAFCQSEQSQPIITPAERELPLTAPLALSVREGSQLLAPTSHVSAAYSLDPLIAEAQMQEDHVRIWGRSPGRAAIVLVRVDDFTTNSMQVIVTQAPPILPDTVWSGLNSENQNAKGYYELRISSDPMQVSDAFDYRTGAMQVHITNAIVPGLVLPGSSSIRFPFSYLRLVGDRWKLTLLDDIVESSRISVSSTLLRGIHFSEGGLTLHAGYTSVAGFQSLFLPAYKQLIFGSTFAHHLSQTSQIGVTAYFLQRNPVVSDRRTAQALATLFYKRHTLQGSDFSAEVGMSKGIGGAVSLAHDTDTDQFYLAARYRPRLYAASDTDNLNGLQSEARWNHLSGEHFISDLSGSANDIFTRSGAQKIEVAAENLRYKAFNGISLSSGVSISSFSDTRTLFPSIHRFAVPLAISYDRPRFGLGAQYEYSQTSQAFSAGQAYRGSARWSGQHFQMNAGGGFGTQSLGVDSVYSTFPGLNTELAQLGLGTSTSIDQLAAFLKDRAFLNSLGIGPTAIVQLVPRTWQANLNLSWRSGRQVVEFDSNYNRQSFLIQESATVLQTIRYRRGLSNSTELVTSLTLLDTATPVARRDLVWELGLRHEFGDSPFKKRHLQPGIISGTVRIQDGSGNRPAEAVAITLDSDRRTSSDTQGHYRFSNVRQGFHTVQIAFQSSRPFWYTTPAKANVQADSIVNFGVIYPSAQVIGYVFDDAGMGLTDVGVLVKGPQGELNLTTDRVGKFVLPVAQTGAYFARVKAETVPDGYAFEELQPASISIEEGESKKVSFTLAAIRALTGSVREYDSVKGEYVPVAGVTVQVAELHRQTISDGSGRYLFRNLPSGVLTILVNGKEYGQIQVSAAPQLLRQDIQLKPKALADARQ